MPSTPTPNTTAKRKGGPLKNPRSAKAAKTHRARAISSQTTDVAFNNGDLNVDKFVKAREYEIKALEDGLKRAKGALSTRAFQDVPMDLRRRSASHNVKRVPKRLRARAGREMVRDNTPTVTPRRRKGTPHQRLRLETALRLQKLSIKSKERRLEKKAQRAEAEVKVTPAEQGDDQIKATHTPAARLAVRRPIKVKQSKLRTRDVPPAKFRKRQIHKTWLPTHLFHSKRAHMTPPKEPLWKFALPLTPTAKSYRPIHRAGTQRGAVAWDTSYMSTIGLEGPERSIEGLFKALGVGAGSDEGGLWSKTGSKWRAGTRAWEGWLHEREAWPAKGIAPVTVIWNPRLANEEDAPMESSGISAEPTKKKEKRRVFIRVHPAGFMQLWEQIVRLGRVQKPSVSVEDLRFEIGSIQISGPNATEALVGALWPSPSTDGSSLPSKSSGIIWPNLAFHSPASLPANAIMAFDTCDPRLHHPPRTVTATDGINDTEKIVRLLASWPLDHLPEPATIFERNNRLKAGRSLPSQKAINRRKALASPGTFPDPRPEDPRIPTLLCASRTKSSGSWTVLLPWKCVPPAWTSLMYYPLSIGGSVRFGGLQQTRQIAFESGTSWFPGDFPGTKAGDEWEIQEQIKRKADWERKPKGRRTEWESLDLGMNRKGEIGIGWACDWQLFEPKSSGPEDAKEPFTLEYIPRTVATRVLGCKPIANLSPNPLITVKVTMVGRGVPQTCARIYRLPTNNAELRKKWLDQIPLPASKKANSKKAPFPQRPGKDATPAMQRSYIAATIFATPPSQAEGVSYPSVPDEHDLIGFVTTGNFNLGEGKGIGIGSLLLNRVISLVTTANEIKSAREDETGSTPADSPKVGGPGAKPLPLGKEERFCIVRDAGQAIGRLARWELA